MFIVFFNFIKNKYWDWLESSKKMTIKIKKSHLG